MLSTLQSHVYLVLSIVGLIAFVSIILAISSLVAQASLRRKFKRWKGIYASADLEAVYEKTITSVIEIRQELQRMQMNVNELENQLSKKLNTPHLIRYNAFSQTGSDLSYSVAFLDGNQTGVVLTSIYGREESHTYGKPIIHGESSYLLTDEEQQVISTVLNGENAEKQTVRS